MKKEILEKILDDLNSYDGNYDNYRVIHVDKIEAAKKKIKQLIKSEEQQEKPECDFLPGQVLKVWDNDPENWTTDIFEQYSKYNDDYPYLCGGISWKHAEPLPLENHIANIAFYIPDAVKAVVDVEGYIYFRDGNNDIIENTGYFYKVPYPNNTGKDIEIEIKR
jgi:hypothetical protein